MGSEILRAAEVSILVRISTKKIYELSRENKIPCFKFPGSRLFFYRKADIESWLGSLDHEGRIGTN